MNVVIEFATLCTCGQEQSGSAIGMSRRMTAVALRLVSIPILNENWVNATVVWCGVVWCGVVWCGVVWHCGVVCCVVLCRAVVCGGVVWHGVVLCCAGQRCGVASHCPIVPCSVALARWVGGGPRRHNGVRSSSNQTHLLSSPDIRCSLMSGCELPWCGHASSQVCPLPFGILDFSLRSARRRERPQSRLQTCQPTSQINPNKCMSPPSCLAAVLVASELAPRMRGYMVPWSMGVVTDLPQGAKLCEGQNTACHPFALPGATCSSPNPSATNQSTERRHNSCRVIKEGGLKWLQYPCCIGPPKAGGRWISLWMALWPNN